MTVRDNVPVTVRIPPPAVSYLTQLAQEHGVGRSDVFRVMLAVASQHPDEITAKIISMRESFV